MQFPNRRVAAIFFVFIARISQNERFYQNSESHKNHVYLYMVDLWLLKKFPVFLFFRRIPGYFPVFPVAKKIPGYFPVLPVFPIGGHPVYN